MHHNFRVSADVVAFGSANWARTALNNNYECLIVVRGGREIVQFRHEFAGLREEAHSIELSGQTVRSIVCLGCKCSRAVDLEIYGPFCTSCGQEFGVVDSVGRRSSGEIWESCRRRGCAFLLEVAWTTFAPSPGTPASYSSCPSHEAKAPRR